MNRNSLVPANDEFSLWEKTKEVQERQRSRGWLAGWYAWTAPVDPGQDARLERRERFRRGRLASVILLLMLFTVTLFVPQALSSKNVYTLPTVLSLYIICGLAVFLNRQGRVNAVGVLVVLSVDATLAQTFLTAPVFALNINSLPVFDLFILSELAAVSILEPEAVFVVAFVNCVYTVASILLMPHSTDLAQLMKLSFYGVLIRPVALQIAVAVVTYLWVRNAQNAIKRADQAELVAQLEHTIAEQKRNLDSDIQQLHQTLVQAANGDLSVRSPLSQEHLLWQVSVSLNNLLARLQRSNQSDYELQRIKTELSWLSSVLRNAKLRRVPIPLATGGEVTDPLYRELSGHYLLPPPQETRRPMF